MAQIINLSSVNQANAFSANQKLNNYNSQNPLPEVKRSGSNDTIEENDQLLSAIAPDKILFSLKDAASILGVSYDFVRNAAIQGKIDYKQFGNRRLIHKNELSLLITRGVN